MKGSLQFEGIPTAGSGNYSSGFGVIAVPFVSETKLTGKVSCAQEFWKCFHRAHWPI